jgi:hypothetical protein
MILRLILQFRTPLGPSLSKKYIKIIMIIQTFYGLLVRRFMAQTFQYTTQQDVSGMDVEMISSQKKCRFLAKIVRHISYKNSIMPSI